MMPKLLHRSASIAGAVIVWLAACPNSAHSRDQQACAVKRGKIVGGANAVISGWPGQAAIRLHSERGHVSYYFCGGTAISERWVLTAAHCMHEFLSGTASTLADKGGIEHPARLEVLLETEDLTKPHDERAIAVEQVIVHEVYRPHAEKALQIANEDERDKALDAIAGTVGHDIALLKLARPWRGRVSELSLAASTDPRRESGVQVRVAGFGKTETTRKLKNLQPQDRADKTGVLYAGSALLLETAVETVAPTNCRQRYPKSLIGPAQLCAGEEQKARDSCHGDSGGPLVVPDAGGCPRQIGIVSWGYGCADRDKDGRLYYGVYTRVSAFADWIQRHTGPLKGASVPLGIDAGRLSAAQLDEALTQLASVLGTARGRVTIGVRGGNRVRLGEKVIFEASSNIAGRLVILDINADREVTLLYPNKFVAQSDIGRIAGGSRVAVPGANYPGFTSFQAVEPAGKGRLIAIVAPEDFDVQRFVAEREVLTKGFQPRNDPPSYLMRLIRQIETALGLRTRAGSAARADELARWGYAVAEYEIVR